MADRKPTSTSNFGVGRRENHDASAFYARFQAPEISKDDTVLRPAEVDAASARHEAGRRPRHGRRAHRVGGPGGHVAAVLRRQAVRGGSRREGIPSSYREYLELLEDVFAECARTLEPGGRIAVNVANLGRKPYRSLSADVTAILQDRLRLLLRGGSSGRRARAPAARAPGARSAARQPHVPGHHRAGDRRQQGPLRPARSEPRPRAGRPARTSTVTADRLHGADARRVGDPAESARRVGHPAPFPVELPEWLIDLYTYEGDLVLDPFMGSGSTMVAAVRTGRRYVGYDIEPEYVAIAEQRVRRSAPAGPPSTCSSRSTPLDVPPERRGRPTTTGDKDADFQRRATEEGKAAQAIAEKVLIEAGFEIVGRNARLRGLGMTMNFVAVDQRDEEWYFDVSKRVQQQPAAACAAPTRSGRASAGPTCWPTRRPAEPRRSSCSPPTCPAGSDGDRALHAATAGAFFDAIEMYDPEGQGRLAGLRRGRDDGPLVGFWTGGDRQPPMGLSVACAVLRGEPPTVFLAEDLGALHWTLATEVVARARDQDWPAPLGGGASRAAGRALGRRGARLDGPRRRGGRRLPVGGGGVGR